MTWSKESIGNTTVEKTPSKNGSRRKKSAESVIRRRRPSSTRIVPRARSIESVRRKYSPKKQLTVYSPKRDSAHSLSTSYEREESPRDDADTKPPKDENSPSTSKKLATVRRTHAFRRSSHYRRAFREQSPRVLLPMYDNNDADIPASTTRSSDIIGSQPILANDAVTTALPQTLCTGDAADEECSTSDNPTLLGGVEVCTLEAVVVSFADDDDDDCGSDVDVGPEPIVLQPHDHTTCALTSTEISSQEVGVSGTRSDVGPEPTELLDTAVDIGEDRAASRGTEKRPSILKRVLSKSSSLMKKTMSSRRSHQGKTADMKCSTTSSERRRRRRAHVPTRRMIRRPRKVVVMGDMFSGKSSLISAYCHDRFSTNYVPTLLNTLSTDAQVFGESIELVVVDVGGRDDYAKLRKCAYHKMDIIILCYAADSPDSLQRIVDYWVPEIKRHCPKVPFILVATKKDLRDDALYESSGVEGGRGKEGVVSTISGRRVAETVGAQKFLECSARYRDNTRNVFEMAAKVALQKSRRKRK